MHMGETQYSCRYFDKRFIHKGDANNTVELIHTGENLMFVTIAGNLSGTG